jgi:hypothetical protein
MAWLDSDPDEGDGKATQADIRSLRSEARSRDTPPDDGGGGSSTGSSTSITIPNASRKVVGLMALAVIFSVIGQELKAKEGGAKPVGGLSGPAKTILGGTIATALLSFLAEAGSTGQQLGVGLASVACVTAVFVNGAPVWKGISNLFGGTPTTPLTASTASTTAAGRPASTGQSVSTTPLSNY